ncbi:hypothetical protein DRF67_15025 [Chryseobacterium pennipullorum]|uniref:Uncharacterized protein n=1 Tax=Chryseobacterium pennipullorum TaxID=2258963 RepID=A0A3D9AY73_9FLAO|nr:hypothetical protein DRF67_15025 [Chryseobacterium pennipullorum]
MIVLIVLIPIFYFGIINTQVSLKYETSNPGDCISNITNRNLCQDIKQNKILIVTDLVLVTVLLMFRSKIIRD